MKDQPNKKQNQASKDDSINEGKKYDKILKENAIAIFMRLVEWHFKFKIKEAKKLDALLQTTLEREMDALFEVETVEGKEFLLHIEFQSKNEPDMLKRMLEYHGIAMRKYNKPIKHLAVYLGSPKVNMPNQLPEELQFTGFDILSIRDLDPTILLSSQVPEVVMLAILSKYPKEQGEQLLKTIIQKLMELTDSKGDLNRYLQQLTIISNLRILEVDAIKTIQAMTFIDLRSSSLYQMGVREGTQKGKEIGLEEGKEIGLEEGKEIGEEIGIEKGKEIGAEEERIKQEKRQQAKRDQRILQAIKQNILSFDQIAALFEVTVAYVEALGKLKK